MNLKKLKMTEILGSVATIRPFSISIQAIVKDPQEFLGWLHLRNIPVVDEKNRILGVITYRDILKALISPPNEIDPRENTAFEVRRLMQTRISTISFDSTVAEALQLLRTSLQGCLFVVKGGYLYGLITEADVVNLIHNFKKKKVAEKSKIEF